MATALEDEHSLCLLVTSSVHPEHCGRYEENTVLGLCFKKSGHLSLISSEALLQRALFISKHTKTSIGLLPRITQIWNRSQNLNDQSQGSLKKSMCLDCSGGWWGVLKFCVKSCMLFTCENLRMGTESGQVKRQCQWGGYQNVKKREGAYSIQLVRQWPYSGPI